MSSTLTVVCLVNRGLLYYAVYVGNWVIPNGDGRNIRKNLRKGGKGKNEIWLFILCFFDFWGNIFYWEYQEKGVTPIFMVTEPLWVASALQWHKVFSLPSLSGCTSQLNNHFIISDNSKINKKSPCWIFRIPYRDTLLFSNLHLIQLF